MKKLNQGLVLFVIGSALQMTTPAFSGELTYTPKNPGFGGNPLNEDYLVGLAQIQNQHVADSSSSSGSSSFDFPDISIDLGDVGSSPTVIVPITGSGSE